MSPNPTVSPAPAASKYTKKDFQSDQEVRWCPGCGDYSVLNAVQQVFATLGIPREKFVVVSGIGCSSRFPYYMNTYGFHTLHGRALGVASGVKLANPDLSVWVATGDGDGLAIGGNHTLHALRRNIDLKIILFNNRIYGLTKGQYSPTSEFGKISKSTPYGTAEQPINPLSVALGAEATWVGRTFAAYPKHITEMVKSMAAHRGSSFLEVYQNCLVFNDGAYDSLVDKDVRDDVNLALEHGKPLIFGRNHDKGIRLNGFKPEVVKLGENGVTEKDLLVHDEKSHALAFLLSRLEPPEMPVLMGVFRNVDRPTMEDRHKEQVSAAAKKLGEADLNRLFRMGETWVVK